MRMAWPILALAARDYRWLLDRGYPPKASLKLVGDRRMMTKDERMILFRGVAPTAAAASRAAIVRSEAKGRAFLVDGYNQALTVMHYLTGRPVFVANDGLLRDAGGSYGRIADLALFERAVDAIAGHIVALGPLSVGIFLDSPVPGSAGHARMFRDLFASRGAEVEVRLEKSADAPLKKAPPLSLVATSDSAIADALVASSALRSDGAWLYDAARHVLELDFGRSELLDLGYLLSEGEGSENELR